MPKITQTLMGHLQMIYIFVRPTVKSHYYNVRKEKVENSNQKFDIFA